MEVALIEQAQVNKYGFEGGHRSHHVLNGHKKLTPGIGIALDQRPRLLEPE